LPGAFKHFVIASKAKQPF